ncbi:MAG: hypothetical protein JW778_01440 [Candidatus Altiarchaeota archaeon]|nr:hypothetical protein [Candidatus Altiarchaeota archaeon]
MKHITIALLIMALVLMSGCAEIDMLLGYGEEWVCDTVDPSSVNPDWDRSHCYKDAADRKNTPETCQKIEDSAPKTRCYMELAEELGKPDLCNNLLNHPASKTGDYSRLECIQRTAVANGDQTICDQMGTETYIGFTQTYNKEECIKAVQSTPPKYPGRAGFDPTDSDATGGGAGF